MTSRRVNLYPQDHRSDRGMALVTTLLIITIMGILVSGALLASAETAPIARNDDNHAAALGAADAGVDDLLYRLNAYENTSFQLAENIYCYDQVQTGGSVPASCQTTYSPALPPAAQGWVTIPNNNDGVRTLQYEYWAPSNHQPNANGPTSSAAATGSNSIIFDVAGRSVSANGQSSTRSIRVVLNRSTFLNYGYFTNVETEDPQQYDLDPALPGWPEFGPAWGSGITAWTGPATQIPPADPANASDAALRYCQNYWFEPNTNTSESSATSGWALSTDPRSMHSEQGAPTPGYSLNNVCTFTKWETGDTFMGPVRTNDVIFVDGATQFNGPVYVGSPCNMVPAADATASNCPAAAVGAGSSYTANAGNNDGKNVFWVDTQQILYGATAAPNFAQPPSYKAPVGLPAQNTSLSTEAAAGGCVYEGMTYFNFLTGGQVYVYSPGTIAAVLAGTFTLNAGCSDSGNVTLSSLTNPVLYVQSASGANCLDTTYNDYTFGGLVQSNDYYTGLLAYNYKSTLHQWTYGTSPSSDPLAFACNNGDAWVGGVVNGSVTVGADHNIVVYQNLTYPNNPAYTISGNTATPNGANSGDVIGLEPINDVVVYHPVDCPNWDTNWNNFHPSPGNPAASCVSSGGGNSANNDFGSACPVGQATTWTRSAGGSTANCQVNDIYGAILAFQGEYTAENFSFGANMGTLTEFGSVSQAFRGRLAGTSTGGGYGKQYVYDARLSTLSPPSFLPPNLFDWSEATWSEVSGQVTPITNNTEVVPPPPTTTQTTLPTYTVPAATLSAPAFTGPTSTTFTAGTAGTFQVTATGSPTPSLTDNSYGACVTALPSGVTFTPTTGALSGTPSLASSGAYQVCLEATNSAGVTQETFTLTVVQIPVITSANSTTFAVGSAGTFTVTASGSPAPTFLDTSSGLCTTSALPTGITFTAATGVLSGTDTGAAGSYTICFRAQNTAGTSAVQTFTFTISKAASTTSFVAPGGVLGGTTITFTVTVTGTDGITPTGTPTWTIATTNPTGSASCSTTTALVVGAGSSATATCKVTGVSSPTKYQATATYVGDTHYNGSSGVSLKITG